MIASAIPRLLWVAVLACLAALPACIPQRSEIQLLSEKDLITSCGRAAFADQPGPNYFKLKDKILANPQRYPDRKAVLRELSPEFRRHFVLVHRSRSVQSSPEGQPRIVFFGDFQDPTLLIGVSGAEPAEAEDAALEIIEYSKSQRRFCFRTIQFDDQGPSPDDQPFNCISCHKIDGRPIWDPFNTWPNFYGSRHSEMASGSNELKGFNKFTQVSRRSGVYALLEGPSNLFSPSHDQRISFEIEPRPGVQVKPFADLTTALNKLNFGRITRLLEATPLFERYKYAIQASFIGCEDIPSFLPKDLQLNHPLAFIELVTRTKEDMNTAHAKREATITFLNMPPHSQLPSGNLDANTPEYLYTVAALRYLIENRGLGSTGMADWSMSFEGGYAFASDRFGITDLGIIMAEQNFATYPELYQAISNPALYNIAERQTLSSQKIKAACSILKSHSLTENPNP